MGDVVGHNELLQQLSTLLAEDANKWEIVLNFIEKVKRREASISMYGEDTIQKTRQHIMGLKQFAQLTAEKQILPFPYSDDIRTGKKNATADDMLTELTKLVKDTKPKGGSVPATIK